ncbi:hypothetical protein LJK88_33635 [Paenibacillus sp. P26]|nr:hypothetical protein LJK88_33635 [Paenibacillus sp. P26]
MSGQQHKADPGPSPDAPQINTDRSFIRTPSGTSTACAIARLKAAYKKGANQIRPKLYPDSSTIQFDASGAPQVCHTITALKKIIRGPR